MFSTIYPLVNIGHVYFLLMHIIQYFVECCVANVREHGNKIVMLEFATLQYRAVIPEINIRGKIRSKYRFDNIRTL
jgi:hypothetical protein